jgi:hypothetical protein
MRYLIITFLLLSCLATRAQNVISGSIIDENNAEPLIGATVVI